MLKSWSSTIVSVLIASATLGCNLGPQDVRTNRGTKTMKIAPYTKRWNEGETDWSYVSDPTSALAAWEHARNISLPQDYRNFLVKYNGGRVFPRLFKHKMGPLQAGPYVDETGQTYLDLILPWESVESHWRRETYGDGVPPEHLVIGDTPGGIQILMSVRPTDKGTISSWYHSTSAWGTDGNTKTHPLADSFTDFLRSLYDDGNDYEGWHIPVYDKVAKDLEL